MRLIRAAAVLVGLCSTAALVTAAEPFNIRTGLWTMHTSLTFGGAPLYVMEMSASQKAEYAKTWATMINKPQTDDDDDCVTQKDILEATLLKGIKEEGKNCKESNVTMTATTMKATIECRDDKTSTRTDVDFTAANPTTFRGTVKSAITSPNGVTTMNAAMTATFKSASCPKGHDD